MKILNKQEELNDGLIVEEMNYEQLIAYLLSTDEDDEPKSEQKQSSSTIVQSMTEAFESATNGDNTIRNDGILTEAYESSESLYVQCEESVSYSYLFNCCNKCHLTFPL